MPVFICLKNGKNLLIFGIKTAKISARNKYCGTIVRKLSISTASLLGCMKNGFDPWNQIKSNVWQSWTDDVSGLLSLRQHESELPFDSLWSSLEILSEGHKKLRRFICKRKLKCIFLWNWFYIHFSQL